MTPSLPDAALDAAAGYLTRAGIRVLDRNWQCADGNLHIVAADRETFVAVAVTTISGTAFGTPLEAIGRARIRRLRRLAVGWLNAHGVRYDRVRVDVVGLVYEGSGGYTIRHIKEVG
jgi:putative endonuclease